MNNVLLKYNDNTGIRHTYYLILFKAIVWITIEIHPFDIHNASVYLFLKKRFNNNQKMSSVKSIFLL